MAAQWYYTIDGAQQLGPITNEQLAQLAKSGQLQPTSQVWKEGMAEWVEARRIKGLFTDLVTSSAAGAAPVKKTSQVHSAPMAAGAEEAPPGYDPANSKRVVAGILALLLGWTGAHKFYLGLKQPAWTTLLVSVLPCCLGTMVMGPITLIEGIIYLTKSDEDFYKTYIVEKKAWF